MKTYRLNPTQMTVLGFALGASAATAPDVDHSKHLHSLAQKVASGAHDGALTLDDNESQYIANVIDTSRGAIPNRTQWPDLASNFDQIESILGVTAKARSGTGQSAGAGR
jgi:hypothetical protein